MGVLFCKYKKPDTRITKYDKALLQLKQQRDTIKQYQRRIEQTLEEDKQLTRKLLQDGKKDRVKLMLRKKRHQEQILQKTNGQLKNLEQLLHDMELCRMKCRQSKRAATQKREGFT